MRVDNLEVYGVIYKIKNLVDGKVYVGQTTMGFNKRYNVAGENIERVYKLHLRNKKLHKHYNKHLLASINANGFNNFEVSKTFDIAFTRAELDIKEMCWIDIYNSTNPKFGYNYKGGGTNGAISEQTKLTMSRIKIEKYKNEPHHCLGKKLTQSTKDKMSEKRKGKDNSMYGVHRYGNLNPMYGKIQSEETKLKISESNKGENNANYGKHLTKEQKQFLSESRKGKNNPVARKIICITTKEVFGAMSEAKEYYNIKSNHIYECCLGKIKSSGKHPVTGEKLKWAYLENS